MTDLNCWVPDSRDSEFSINNLPFGIFSVGNNPKRSGVAIGGHILDLSVLSSLDFFKELNIDGKVFHQESLNAFIRLGKTASLRLRSHLQQWLSDPKSPLREYPHVLVRQQEATLHLPVEVGDYTDFYSSIEHATNVGKMFRDPDNALLPNWKHLPVGYHGRASSIIPSGIPIHRPRGQIMPPKAQEPQFSASGRLDFELEMAFIIGKDSMLGHPVGIKEAPDYIFGLVLFNDWSARDIQKWEYVPLGPFLGKNFASSISPWVVPLEALEPFKVEGPVQDPPVLPYLQYQGPHNYDIDLEVALQPEEGQEMVVSRSNFKYMYWNMYQQLAHHTVNGCNVKVGDMMASGTISGPTEDSYGSMLELSWGGSRPLELPGGIKRSFIEDYDTVIMRGVAANDQVKVGFGEVRTKVLPALTI